MNTKIRLYYFSSNRVTESEEIGIIVLLDKVSNRELSIVCDKRVGDNIEMFANKPEMMNTSLVYVLCDVLTKETDFDFEINIEDVNDGIYVTYLVNTTTGTKYRIKASEAVYLSTICGIPIYIDSTLMKRQSIRHREQTTSMSLPVNVVSMEMLKKALDNAIVNEQYELASKLRDEIRNRNKHVKDTDTDERS